MTRWWMRAIRHLMPLFRLVRIREEEWRDHRPIVNISSTTARRGSRAIRSCVTKRASRRRNWLGSTGSIARTIPTRPGGCWTGDERGRSPTVRAPGTHRGRPLA
jgi:hypothetical protein